MSFQTLARPVSTGVTWGPSSEGASPALRRAFRTWMVERGALFLLLLSPVGALFLGWLA